MRVVKIARCPEHGLHGCRETCFECGGPVEQVDLVDASELKDLLVRVDSITSLVAYRGLDDQAKEELKLISLEARALYEGGS